MQKLGISDLSKKLKSKPLPPLPKKSFKKNKNKIENIEPPRRSFKLEKLTPVSYTDSRQKTQNERRNRIEEEDEEDDEDESEDEDGNYITRKGFKSDLCSRRSSRLQKVTRVNYGEISPKKTDIEEEGENGKDILVGEEGKPEMNTEEHEKGPKQTVSVNRSLHFDNAEHSLNPIESVNSSTSGKDLDVGEVTSSQQIVLET
ncbi:hypothetical protein MKX01_002255 [Papaver californicum]|nr:hypothetical protein MKX01_002255 [Papaver californicum]